MMKRLICSYSVGGMVLLVPLAYASPSDPTWIGGVYDDGDLDNVVVLITSGAGVVEPFLLDDACTVSLAIAFVHQTNEGPAPSETPSFIHARAPPAV